MQDGICPKCSSDEVYDDSNKSVFGRGKRDALNISTFSAGIVRNYVCIDCGYIESYLEKEDKRNAIRENWNRTLKPKRKNDE